MKILCVSDTISPQLENAAHLRRRYHDVELLISCGDLPVTYLEFITSILNVPLFYVRGNHDTNYEENPPGGENLHRRIVEYNGLTFVGLEGSMKYNNSPIQYTDSEMTWMVMQLGIPLKMRRTGVDVFVTHNPAKGIHDLPDRPHQGFGAFLKFIEWYRPRYMIHGHVHTYDNRMVTETQYLDTCIMNINPSTVLEIEPVGARK
ncbi:MAG TPA: metallophosphoesterase [Oceanobacillus sp.]|nr:metallophosphoesterase [Oceanobacillus sp.]